MKRILLSIGTLVAVAALAAGGTYAYFSDTETSVGNTFTTATLSIDDASASWMLPATFDGLKPGDRVRKWVVLKNDGNIDVGILSVTAKNKNGDQALLDTLVVSATGRIGSADPAYFTPDWTGPTATVNSWMNLADMLDTSFYRTPAGVIKPGESYTMTFDFILATSTGDELQGKSASFDMEFYAEQVH